MTQRRYFNVLELLTDNAEVETRDKCEAKIESIQFPRQYPLWGWYRDKTGIKLAAGWDIFGRCIFGNGRRSKMDIFMKGKFYVSRKEWKEQNNENEEV